MNIPGAPILLLVATGALIGLTFPFGKLATDAGVSAFVWSFAIACGAGLALLAATLAVGGRGPRLDHRRLRYFVVAALFSYMAPNILVFSAIPRLGAGFTGVMFTLSPVLTLAVSLLARLRRPSLLGLAGIAIGFSGAVIVTTTRGEIGRPADMLWIGLALLIPLSLAIGNVYRTVDWPEGAGPVELAIGSNLAAAVILPVASLLFTGEFPLSQLARVPGVAGAQIIASAVMFALFFKLQTIGGPVYLSQVGYVAAAVGLLSGVLLLGERYAALTWIGALVIVVGIVMTTLAQREEK